MPVNEGEPLLTPTKPAPLKAALVVTAKLPPLKITSAPLVAVQGPPNVPPLCRSIVPLNAETKPVF